MAYITTSLTQSIKLLELGINKNTADMYWTHIVAGTMVVYEPKVITYIPHEHENAPCWSLSALIELMPSATLDSSNDHHYRLHCMDKFTEWYNNAIDAAFEMVCYLLENKLIK